MSALVYIVPILELLEKSQVLAVAVYADNLRAEFYENRSESTGVILTKNQVIQLAREINAIAETMK